MCTCRRRYARARIDALLLVCSSILSPRPITLHEFFLRPRAL